MHDSNDSLREFQNIPDTFVDFPDIYFPMIITFQKFLRMLDGNVLHHFLYDRSMEGQEGYQLKKEESCFNYKEGKDLFHSVNEDDSVQDLTMAQIALLKHVCNNIDEGFVFAGDIAQTIARGIGFRFENVRSLFYTEFLTGEDSDSMSPANKSETKACSQKGKSKTETSAPDLFHLSQNFRAHTGIIKLAQSVVELLYHFFAFAVDKLSPENSLIYGEAPIYLEMEKDESLITTIFGHGENFGSDRYEFGAEKAILVRDELTKSQVLSQVGKQGLECKGLEFQDVLLFNFFSNSPLGRKWQVIYEFMEQKEFSDHKPHPMFDSNRHNLHNRKSISTTSQGHELS
eukprot:Gb_31735 [translate_table: standard]